MIQHNLFFFMPDLNVTAQLYAPFFTLQTPPSTQFYTSACSSPKPEQNIKMEEAPQGQGEQLLGSLPEPGEKKKNLKIKKGRGKYEDYSPKQESKKAKSKTVYEKDKERNILPNAISKLFFFMKSKQKSEALVGKILRTTGHLGSHLTVSKYYMIHSFIKSQMERYKTEKSIELLYNLPEPECTIFSLSEQLSFIKVNAVLLRLYIRNHLYLDSLLNNKNNEQDKIKAYMRKYRRIEELGQQLLTKVKMLIDFSPIDEGIQHLQ